MQDLTPIPIPAKQRWREFRIAYLPLLTFAGLIAVIAWMWKDYVQPSAIIGEVETVHADVSSMYDGTILELRVDRLQSVTNGQVLAIVAPYNDEQINAELLAAEADLLLLKARMDIDRARNMDSLARLKVDFMTEKLDLELARIRLQHAEGEFERAEKLLEGNLIARGSGADRNDFGYDVALRDRDALRTEIASREKAVAELEAAISSVHNTGGARVDPSDSAVDRAIAAQRTRIEHMQRPIELRAPIDGFVSTLDHRTGEIITSGTPILVVSSRASDRILAWVNQPIRLRPQIGDTIEVRRMGMGSTLFEAKVIEVGTQLEEVSPLLRSPTANPERIEIGLPLLVQADAIRELIPGEPVLLRLQR